MLALEATTVTKAFGGLVAVNQVDFQLPKGSICSIIGPNGAGKTTFFNLITGVYRADGGQIRLRTRRTGHGQEGAVDLVGKLPEQIMTLGVARTFQNIRLFANLTAVENVLVGMHARLSSGIFDAVFGTRRMRGEEQQAIARAYDLLAELGLAGKENELARNLPYGQQRRLELARALASDPEVLLLDEPTAGMNPRETADMIALIRRVRDERDLSVLLIEHDMHVVMGLSEKITVLDYGVKIAEGTPDDVRRDPRVIEAYLGRHAKKVRDLGGRAPEIVAGDAPADSAAPAG